LNEQFDGTNDFTERSFSGKTNKNDNFENERIHLFFEQLKKGSFRNNKQKNENKSKVPISTVPGNQLFELKAYRTFAQPYPSPIQDRHLIRIIEKNFSFVKFTSNFDD